MTFGHTCSGLAIICISPRHCGSGFACADYQRSASGEQIVRQVAGHDMQRVGCGEGFLARRLAAERVELAVGGQDADGLAAEIAGHHHGVERRDDLNALQAVADELVPLLGSQDVLAFTGSVGLGDENTALDLTFSSPSTDFADILSLVPAIYARDFESLQTSGKMSVSGRGKGAYGPHAFPALALGPAAGIAGIRRLG